MALTGLTPIQITNLNVSGIATFEQEVGVGGTLTYQDVTNVDAVGIITARSGVNVSAGQLDVGNNIKIGNAGVATAVNFITGVSNLHNVGLTLSGGQIDVGSNIKIGNAGVVTATAFHGDISNATGAAAGLGTALSSTQTSPLNKLYYTNRVLSVGSTITVDHPASATGAYTQYADIQVEDDADLIVADGDDLIPDIFGIGGTGTTGAGGAGRLLVDNIVNRSGTGAPTLPNGAVVSGVVTATSFVGSGANLTGISAGVVKAAVRRYYGTSQTTGISNSGFTQINVAYVDIVPTSASNYIKLGGLFTWDGSDTEPTYSFRWKKVITGGSTTSIDSGQGSGNRVGITYKVSGNGGLACMNLDSIYDLAGTTSSIRYYLEVFVDGAGQTLWVNRTHADLNDPRDERGASYFVAEEINNSIFTFTNNS